MVKEPLERSRDYGSLNKALLAANKLKLIVRAQRSLKRASAVKGITPLRKNSPFFSLRINDGFYKKSLAMVYTSVIRCAVSQYRGETII